MTEFRVDGEAAEAATERLTVPFEVWPGVIRQIAELVRESSEESFRVQRAPDGTPWKPLAASTAKEKARKGYSPLALIRGGRLQTLTAYACKHLNRPNSWFHWVVVAVGATTTTFVMCQSRVVDRPWVESRGLWDYAGIVVFIAMWCAILWFGGKALRTLVARR